MIEFINALASNPENPEKIQISFPAFMAIDKFMAMIDTATLSKGEKAAHEYVTQELHGKKGRIATRQAYASIIHAQTPAEKQAAYEAYIATKELYA